MRELRCLEPSLNEMKDITVTIDHNSTKLDNIKIMLFPSNGRNENFHSILEQSLKRKDGSIYW